MTRLALLLPLAAISLAGCDQLGIGGSAPASDTNMRSVEIEVGTASDEMILLDQSSGDGTAIDPSSAVGPTAPRPATSGAASEGEDSERPTTETRINGDQVIRPPASGAEPDSPEESVEN
jgi:hypothetical protein